MLMKKFTAVIAALVITMGSFLSIYAESPGYTAAFSDSGEFIIETGNDGLKYISSYYGKGGDIRLPENANGVLKDAFKGNMDITSVTIPPNCTYLDTGAFQYCANLEKVVVKGDVSFGDSAFGTCPSLETVIVEGSVMDIKSGAFYECTSLKTVQINENKYDFSIGTVAFFDCHYLASINIPDKCKEISPGAFHNCFSLTNLTIPENTNIIYDDYAYNLGMLELMEDYKDPESLFWGVSDGKIAGYGRTYYSKDTAPSGKTMPYEHSENIVYKIKKFTPKALTLTVTEGSAAEKYAEKYGIAYKYAERKGNNEPDAYESGDFTIVTGDDGSKYVSAYNGSGGDIRLPEEADGVLKDVFKDNKDITSVTFPSDCRYLNTSAFQYCANLEKVVFEGDAYFGDSAFGTCPSLKTVIVKGSVINIEFGAFYECTALKTVTFSESEYDFEIGTSAFQDCHSLKTINISDKCKRICPRAFFNCISMTELAVPENTKVVYGDAYQYNFGMCETINYDKSGFTRTALASTQYNKINGRTYYSKDKYSADDAMPFEHSENIVYKVEELTPVSLMVTVIDDSSASRYADKYGVDRKLYDSTADGKLAAPNFFTYTRSQTLIDLKWETIKGADSYRIYMYDPKTDRYKKYKDIKDAKCIVGGLNKNTEYRFRVTALVKVNGKYEVQTPSWALFVKTSE